MLMLTTDSQRRELLEVSPLFTTMDDLGFYDSVEENLPAEFTLIYEIARVLEMQDSQYARDMAPILELNTEAETTTQPEAIPVVLEAREYEADLIRSVTDVRYIYPHQHLLPERVFLQRLAERTLWMPRPKAPRNFRYQVSSNLFSPDDRKQKVYILFDTSASMRQAHRMHVAKAVAWLFLRRNRKELGTVFFRTFDVTMGDLLTATDVPSYNSLIRAMMMLKPLGSGTVLQKAIETALSDILHQSALSQAQILVITDGVAHVDYDSLKEAMGDVITLNAIKIGDATLAIDDKLIESLVRNSSSDDAIQLKDLVRQKHDIEVQMRSATGVHLMGTLSSRLNLVDRQIHALSERIAAGASEHFGSELRRLSRVYVNVPDLDASVVFRMSLQQWTELEELARALLSELRQEAQSEDLRRAAALYDHLHDLVKYNEDVPDGITRAVNELEIVLDTVMNEVNTHDATTTISDVDRKQLRRMLLPSGKRRVGLLKMLRLLWLRLKRLWRAGRQLRRFESLAGRTIRRRR